MNDLLNSHYYRYKTIRYPKMSAQRSRCQCAICQMDVGDACQNCNHSRCRVCQLIICLDCGEGTNRGSCFVTSEHLKNINKVGSDGIMSRFNSPVDSVKRCDKRSITYYDTYSGGRFFESAEESSSDTVV
jgi:hypothetical protein